MGHWSHSAEPDQTTQNGAFDQGLHCLLTEFSLKICILTHKIFKRKMNGPNDKDGLKGYQMIQL